MIWRRGRRGTLVRSKEGGGGRDDFMAREQCADRVNDWYILLQQM